MKTQHITLTKPVRNFQRSEINPIALSNEYQFTMNAGTELEIGEATTMIYDHRGQRVVPIIGENPELFIIIAELDRDSWHTEHESR